jgi:ribosomal protein S27E
MTDKTQEGRTVTLPCRECGNRFEQIFHQRIPLKMHCPECVESIFRPIPDGGAK